MFPISGHIGPPPRDCVPSRGNLTPQSSEYVCGCNVLHLQMGIWASISEARCANGLQPKETRTSGMRQHPCLVRALCISAIQPPCTKLDARWCEGPVSGQWAVSCLRRAGKQSVGEILFRDRFQGFPGSFHRFFCGFYYGVGHFFGLFDHMLHSLLDGFGGVGQVLPAGAGVMTAASDPAGPAALTGICLHNGQ